MHSSLTTLNESLQSQVSQLSNRLDKSQDDLKRQKEDLCK